MVPSAVSTVAGLSVLSLLDPDSATWDLAFQAWAQEVVRTHHAAKPALPPYPLEMFDGCSGIPDNARWACLLHDVRYWNAETPNERLAADRFLRDDVISMGRFDPAWRWLWWLRGWSVFAGVRAFGWLFAGKGSRHA